MDDFSRTLAVITQGMQARLHVGAQIYVSRDGHTLLDHADGIAREGVPMSTDTLMVWMSSSKPLTAAAVMQLVEGGQVALDDPVAKHIPEFAAGGKDAVTVRQALCHTGGFRGVASRMDALPWDQAVHMICQQRLEPGWTPGEKAGYHIASSWYILGELVQRLGGEPIGGHLHRHVFQPAGMSDTWLGMPTDQYHAYGDRIGVMHLLSNGQLKPHPALDTLAWTQPPRPASNARGPVRSLGRFYQWLQKQPVVDDMARPQRGVMLDQTFRLNLDWGLGLIVNTPGQDMDRFTYGFGPHASPRAFGHGGNQSSLGMADPEHNLVVAVVFNGMPGELAHAQRIWALMTAIYEDLQLA